MLELLTRSQGSPGRPPRRPPLSRKRMESLVAALLRCEGRDLDVELSVLFCDDPVIQALNREYRGIDQPTDVLSFPQEETPAVRGQGSGVRGQGGRQHTLVDRGQPAALGDVVISLETAQRQAKAQKHLLRREVEWLLLHGTLHLLGYDDTTEEGLRSMIERQEEVLEELPSSVVSSQPA